MSFRENLKSAKRIVVKVGTSTLTYENGNINLTRIEKLTRVLSDMLNSGKEIVLVSSGAIGVGASKLKLKEKIGKKKSKSINKNKILNMVKVLNNIENDYFKIYS